MPYTTLLILIGTGLLGACAGLVGSFTVLRKRALAGDALAHAALPGVCIAFLIGETQSLPVLLSGAMGSGLLGILVLNGLRRYTRIKEDAATGIVLSVFYGAGIVLLSYIQNRPDRISSAGLRSFLLGKTAGMSIADVQFIAGAAALCLVTVWLLFKEFQMVAFDAGFARVQGWPAFGIDLLLMTLVALTVMIGLPAVGVVLTAAVLIIPAAAARFWTERLGLMLTLSTIFGLCIGVGGSALSAGLIIDAVRGPTGPVIVLVGTVVFLTSLLFAPRRGVIARVIRETRFRRTLEEQAVLQDIVEMEARSESELSIRAETLDAHHPASPGNTRGILKRLSRDGLLDRSADSLGWRLTEKGRSHAEMLFEADRRLHAFLDRHAELASEFATLDRAEVIHRLNALESGK